tara:strand:+ start:1526 stop:1750 length:225 start_codon:yes stop_codon:yes gene_type:complete
MTDEVKIISGIRSTRIIYKVGETQMVREIEENLDENFYISPISIEDFEIIFNFNNPDQRFVLFDKVTDQKREVN